MREDIISRGEVRLRTARLRRESGVRLRYIRGRMRSAANRQCLPWHTAPGIHFFLCTTQGFIWSPKRFGSAIEHLQEDFTVRCTETLPDCRLRRAHLSYREGARHSFVCARKDMCSRRRVRTYGRYQWHELPCAVRKKCECGACRLIRRILTMECCLVVVFQRRIERVASLFLSDRRLLRTLSNCRGFPPRSPNWKIGRVPDLSGWYPVG